MKKYKILIILFLLTTFMWVSFWTDVTQAVHSVALDWVKFVSKILNVLYMLVRPFLIIAWKLLSNTFVYGSSFSIDTVLWKVWQMSRTAMNYFLWIIFIVSIIIYFFKSSSKLSLKQIFPKVVIASIIVNLSWFLLAVIFDISSILLVVAWWIWDQFNRIVSQWVGKNIDNDCLILPVKVDTDSKWAVMKTDINWKNYPFCIFDKDMNVVNKWKDLPCIDFRWWSYKLIVNKWWDTKPIEWCITSKDINYSSVGMLFSIFRYMNMAFVSDNTNWENTTFWLFFVKLVLMLALVIPFILLTIILVIRLMVLWIVIPLTPFLFWLPIIWIFDSKIKDKITNIFALIFQPAYIVFMLSIWFVFIQSVYVMMPSVWWEEKSKNILKTLEVEQKWKNEVELLWILNITSNYDKWTWTNTNMSDYKNLLSYISWVIANLMAIILLWILVFIAFKSNSFTKKIATSVDTVTKKWLEALPILPWGQSVASLGKVYEHLNSIPKTLTWSQLGKLKEETKKMFK